MNFICIGDICDINPRKIHNLQAAQEISFVPMESVGTDGELNTEKTITVDKIKNYTFFKDGDVLFAKITPCMENGKGCIAKHLLNGYGAGSSEFIVLRPNTSIINAQWLQLFLSQKVFRHECISHMTGSAGQKRVPAKYLASCRIPVPSLDEQERIVAKIEELFSSLDNTTETLQRNKTLFKQYKLAVLSSAFKECSEKQSISQLASLVTSGSRGWAQYYSEQGVRFIRITDLSRDGIKLDDTKIQRVQLPHNVEGTRSKLNPHDILVSITADLGSIALVPEDIEESYINQHIALIRLKKPNQAKLIAWYLKSIEGRNALLKNKRGGGKLGLGLDDIRNTPVPCLSDHETKKVISAIEAQLAVCEYQEAISEKVLRQISALKQSILKKAFEGKLI